MVIEKKQITRNRVSLSCQTCRRRKVKCGKERPICATCHKAGEECIYTDADRADSSRVGEVNVVSRKRHEPDTGFDQQPVGGLNGSIQAIRAMEQKLNQLSALVHDMSRLTPTSSANSPKEDQNRYTAPTRGILGSLRATGTFADQTKTGLSEDNPLHDGSILRVLTKLDDLNILLKSNMMQQTQSKQPFNQIAVEKDREAQRYRQSVFNCPERSSGGKAPHEIAPEDMMGPSEEESNVLLRSWLWSVYPIFPLISPSLVLEKYQTFRHWYYNDLDRGAPVPDPSFVPFMSVVWLTGQIALTERARKKWFPWIQDESTWYRTICKRIEQYLEVMQTDTHRSIWTISASLIYHQLTVNGRDLTKGNIQNLLIIRNAQGLGLHAERMISQTDPNEAEMRRRIWWEITYADASLSLNSGMPTLIEDFYMDTKEISDSKDTWLGSEDARIYEENLRENSVQPDSADDANSSETSSPISVFYLVMKARLLTTQTLRKILRVNMSARQMPMSELKELRKSLASSRKEIEQIINRVPTRGAPEYGFVPATLTVPAELDHADNMSQPVTEQEIKSFLREDDRSGSFKISQTRTVLSSFHKWARISLSTILDGLDCATYAPFLRNSKSRLWAVSRNCALRVSHSFLRKYLSLAEAPDLRRFRWTWPILFNPMHATIIMLVDLHERPYSDEAPRSRALIDKVLSFSSYEKGIIDFRNWPNVSLPLREGGDEAWMMLRKLRHKAWHKAGLDPEVLWTEEQQMQVGVGKPLSENDLFVRSLREDIIMSHRERLDRSNTKNNAEQGVQQTISRTMRKEAAKQYMHPSQVGPGERVTGSITHDMVNWDSTELPQVLLLRAQQDQEKMPFPPTANLSTDTMNIQPGNAVFGFRKGSQSKNDGDISHLGDLIKKIRQTQIDRSAGTAQTRRATSHTKDIVAKNRSEEVMDIVSQELIDRYSIPEILPVNNKPMSNTMSRERSSSPDQTPHINEIPRFTYFPVAPVRTTQIKVAPATLNDTASYDSHGISALDDTNQCSNILAEDENVTSNMILNVTTRDTLGRPNFMESPATVRNLGEGYAMATHGTNTIDFDFDWARWDEMYGATEGFEDLMMDLASEEHQIAGIHHDGLALGQ